MKNKQKQSGEHILVVADGEFAAPNLIRHNGDWMGIPVQWLHLVPNRDNLVHAKVVIYLKYRDGGVNEQAEE